MVHISCRWGGTEYDHFIEVCCNLQSSGGMSPCWPLQGRLSLLWRHNGRDGVSNHQPHECLLNRSFIADQKKTSKLRVTGLCVGNSPGTGEFPAQMASHAENVSIWLRHHVWRPFLSPQLIWQAGPRRQNLRVAYLYMSCIVLTTWHGTRTVASVMAAMSQTSLECMLSTELCPLFYIFIFLHIIYSVKGQHTCPRSSPHVRHRPTRGSRCYLTPSQGL